MSKASVFGIVTIGLFIASACSADVIIKMKQTGDLQGGKPKVSTGSMVIAADRLAMRWDAAAEAEHGSVIFRADKELLWTVDDRKKSYQQIDKAFADQVAGQMAEAKAQMQAQLAQLSPEQRAQAEEMMKKFAGGLEEGASAFKLDYRKTDETRTINGFACTKYDTYSGEDLVSHAWVAPYSALNLTAADGAVFQKMGEFIARLAGPMMAIGKRDYIPMHELGGVPMLTQEVRDGKVTRETTVESVARGASPAGSFDVPAGYKLESMPSMAHAKH